MIYNKKQKSKNKEKRIAKHTPPGKVLNIDQKKQI